MAEELKEATDEKQAEVQLRTPNAQFICPISKKIMESPVYCEGDGETYEESALKTWLETKNTSPVTQKPLTSKKYVKNWGLKYIIEDWMRAGSARAADGSRLQGLFKTDGEYADLFDVEFLVGPTQFRFGAVRVMVGTLCPYFTDLLLSPEGKAKTCFELPDCSPVAFNQILHLAYNVEPEIDPDNVMEVLKAANGFGLAVLKDECLENLRKNISIPKVAEKFMMILENPQNYGLDDSIRKQYVEVILNSTVDSENAITVFNTALSLRELTPEMEGQICEVILNEPEAVCKSSAFLMTRPDIMIELLKCTYFEVNEELLWSRIVMWAISQAEMEGSNEDDEELRRIIAKKSKIPWGGVFDDEAETPLGFPDAGHKHLALVIPHIRFPLMDLEFFCQNAAPLLGREVADTVMFYHLANRPCAFKTNKRQKPGDRADYSVVAAYPNFEAAKKLPDEAVARWAFQGLGASENNRQWFVIDCHDSVQFQEFTWQNEWDDDETIKDVELYLLPSNVPFDEDVGKAYGAPWVKVQDLLMAKSTEVQTREVRQLPGHETAQYFKFVVTSVYGTEAHRTALNHLQIKVKSEWRTNFANKNV